MPESNKPFVVTDRRKFTKEGELRPDAPVSPEPSSSSAPVQHEEPRIPVAAEPTAPATSEPAAEEDQIPAPTAEQTEQSRFAYEQTADRIDTAIRAANPGADHPPAMNFDQLVQSIYLTAIMQLGGATPEGEQPRIDILGARQSIDMLAVVVDKTKGNLTDTETKLIDSALFELRIAFLEVTQALARSATAKGGGTPSRPGIVR